MQISAEELRHWVNEQWPHLSFNDFTLRSVAQVSDDKADSLALSAAPTWQALPGDAGFRRYFRLDSEPPLLAVYSPPQTEPNETFLNLTRHLRAHGVLTPAIAAVDLERGFFLLEDLGPTLLLEELNDESVDGLYGEALHCLLKLQLCPVDHLSLPFYSRDRLRIELNVFPEWFVSQLLGHDLSDSERRLLDRWFTQLEDSALEQPAVFVHRDFHSRNLVYRRNGPPGVIDFQDAVIGPITYDVVSLLRDCYIRWPQARVKRWATAYGHLAAQAGLMPDVNDELFLRWFDWMGLQRHIKVLGVFARLSLRDSKHGYLKDLPLVIRYTLEIAQQYEEGAEFVEWFERVLMPLVKKQAWWGSQDWYIDNRDSSSVDMGSSGIDV